MANPPFQSRQAQLESGVRGNVPTPFGAGERLQSPTYRYQTKFRFRLLELLCTLFQEFFHAQQSAAATCLGAEIEQIFRIEWLVDKPISSQAQALESDLWRGIGCQHDRHHRGIRTHKFLQ